MCLCSILQIEIFGTVKWMWQTASRIVQSTDHMTLPSKRRISKASSQQTTDWQSSFLWCGRVKVGLHFLQYLLRHDVTTHTNDFKIPAILQVQSASSSSLETVHPPVVMKIADQSYPCTTFIELMQNDVTNWPAPYTGVTVSYFSIGVN